MPPGAKYIGSACLLRPDAPARLSGSSDDVRPPRGVGMSMRSEFKAFAIEGSVMDPAIGVVTGGAFPKTVDSVLYLPDRRTGLIGADRGTVPLLRRDRTQFDQQRALVDGLPRDAPRRATNRCTCSPIRNSRTGVPSTAASDAATRTPSTSACAPSTSTITRSPFTSTMYFMSSSPGAARTPSRRARSAGTCRNSAPRRCAIPARARDPARA